MMYVIITLIFTLNWLAYGENTYARAAFANLNLIPKPSIILPELLTYIYFINILVTNKSKKIFFYFYAFCFIAVFYSFLSLLYSSSIFNLIVGLRNYFGLVILFYIGYFYDNNKIHTLLKFFFIIVLLQVPVAIYQFINSLRLIGVYPGTVYDFVSGTIGGLASNVLTGLLFSVISFLVAFYLRLKNRKYLFLSLLLLVPSIIGSSKGAILYIFALSFYFTITSGRMSKILSSVIVYGIFLSVFILGYDYLYLENSNSSEHLIDIDLLVDSELADRGFENRLSRIQSLEKSFQTISENPFTFIFGYGFGSSSKGVLGADNGKYYSFWEVRHYYDQLIRETGIFGVLGFIFTIFTFSIFLIKMYASTSSIHHKALILGAGGIIIVILIGNMHVDLFNRVQFSYPFGFFMGYIFSKKAEAI